MIISKKHIQYFNPKELTKARKNKKGRKMDKKAKKQKEKNEDIEESKPKRNGSIGSKNGRFGSINLPFFLVPSRFSLFTLPTTLPTTYIMIFYPNCPI